jgi:hypothetical protein
MIADSVTTGGGARNVVSSDLLAASSVMPMPILEETTLPDPVGVKRENKINDNPLHRRNAAPRCRAKSKRAPACRAIRQR